MTFGISRRVIADAVVAFALCLLIGPVQAAAVELINIQFQSSSQSVPAYNGGAVIGGAGDTWNGITSPGGTNIALKNSTGSLSSTGATMSWDGSGLFAGYHNGYTNAFGGGSYDPLMNSYIYLLGGSIAVPQVARTISFNNLAGNTTYDLYVYTEGAGDAVGRNLSIKINGNTITTDHASLSNRGTFVEGENYLKVTGTTDSNGYLSFTYSGVGTGNTGGKPGEADINGIQLRQPSESVPEPSTYVLTGIGGLLIALRLKRYSCA